LEKEKPPVFGMIQRCGEVVIRILDNVWQKTIEPLTKATVLPDSMIILMSMPSMIGLNSGAMSVNHGAGEYARDEDGDGFCKVHVNTMEM
jgi:hypothetical protein